MPPRLPVDVAGETVTSATTVEIDGRELRLSNLDKVLWPATGFTKGELIDYYARVAPALLPHLARRPMTLARFPDGVFGPGWYQTRCPNPPSWLPTLPVPSPDGRGSGRDYCLVDDLPALVWAVNTGSIELHPLLSRAPDLDTPTLVMFDLDPGPPAGLLECSRVALWVRGLLADLGLQAYPKTSGRGGLHVCVPLNVPTTYRETKPFARRVAARVVASHPDHVVDRMDKAIRAGKVFIDWGQNDASKSTAAVYSLRARVEPEASTPVTWDEVEAAVRADDVSPLVFSPDDVLRLVESEGDRFGPVLELQQRLPAE
jgi:bifunctional non-homologous end joining protein LigD